MSFPVAAGILMPEEFDIVQKIYSDISGEAWFTASPERRAQFAASVIDLYRSGVINPHDLALRCRSLAVQNFGNGGIAH